MDSAIGVTARSNTDRSNPDCTCTRMKNRFDSAELNCCNSVMLP